MSEIGFRQFGRLTLLARKLGVCPARRGRRVILWVGCCCHIVVVVVCKRALVEDLNSLPGRPDVAAAAAECAQK